MNKNDEKIYDLLVNSNKYITTEEISKIIGCSEKTVRNSLDRIEKKLNSLNFNYILERKQTKGIKLKVQEKCIFNEIDFLYLDLLKKKNYITDLQKKYYLSYGEIKKYIRIISNNLKKYDINLEIKQKQGIILNFKKEKLNNFLKDFFIERIDNKLDELLNYYYGKTKIKIVDRIISEFQVEERITFTDFSKNYLKILILNVNNISEISNIKSNMWINEIKVKIKKYLNLNISRENTFEFLRFFESKNFLENVDFLCLKNEKIDELICNLNSHFNEIGEKFLSLDKDLMYNLKNHLKLTIYRQRNNYDNKNPISGEIKEQYPYYYNEVFNVVDEFNKKNDYNISIDEVAFITIYIIAVEKSSNYKNTKALLVCNFGNTLSKYTIEILKNNFEWIDFEKAISREELKNYNEKNYLIFSNLKLEGYEYIKIPKNINETYIEKIKTTVTKKNSNYLKLFSEKNFKIINKILTKKDAIDKIVLNSYSLGFVEEKYLQTVIHRENLDSTEIGNGIVLLHGDEKYVKKSHISIFITRNKIKWQEDNVKYIFLIAVKKNEYEKYDMRQFFKALIKFKENIDKKEEFNSLKDFKEILSR
ncbi:MAG: PTS sugar transporter subunit IIA [Peptoniphilaceae bacterium]|nr:PTS sugar transporter subunit IIA [Peptoniphilaceae bacterium]MDD7383841.1 PTS sugar transporter subunit IIA [Peptoniphilaceae bacterium]MDY3737582.1 PTS sugar transporter subunit IIA [Peptoniphilaceae bacterium]